MTAKMLICTVSTVRAAQTELKMFVNYHLNRGVDRMFLFFDDPADESIAHFRNDNRLACIRCDAAHWAALQLPDRSSIEERQIRNASLALELARREGIDWIIHIDSDELVFTPEQQLKFHLHRAEENVDAITFPTLEALPKLRYTQHFFEGIHWFKNAKSIIPHAEAIARVMGCRRVFEYGYFRGHTTGKTAIRVRSSVAGIGIHLPTPHEGEELRIKNSSEAFVLHFDCCTFDDWKMKWKRRYDGTAVASQMRKDRGRQFSDFLAAYQSGSEARLLLAYRRQYIVSTYERIILLGTGLLRRVKLKSGSFQDPH
jgi:hypothetical protein